ncbi:hypothetical protein D5S18_21535 [Nocardia panacis]|uniref:Uncharacterized protein n=1 Tax=Nocardia panacis TaxID=2340916 RepID=A0A3A4KL93_9NOCA|nr:DUF6463 family protein [Nocardia panacis]RJO73747.1 hypothetical protein D5S18_21535 [Nocardia panacis]
MKQPHGNRTIKWTGGIIAGISAGHLAVGLSLSSGYFGDWLSLRLWNHWWEDTVPAMSFWANPGGFGLPLALIGVLVVWMNRNNIVPPAFLAWTVLIWSLAIAFMAEPTPAPVVVVAAAVLLRSIRSATKAVEPQQMQPAGSVASQ